MAAEFFELFQARLVNFDKDVWFPPVTQFLSLERFDCHAMHLWVKNNGYVTPVASVVLYVLLIFIVLPILRWKSRQTVPSWMKHAFALWNLLLAVFSACGVWMCVPFVYRMITTKGVHYALCSDHMMLGGRPGDDNVACYGPVGYLMTFFMLSKFPELVDTIFLVLMHKDVMFLHWYHHVTVLLYSWFAYHSATPSAVIFGTMNYCVHSVMYFYFFFSQYSKALSFLRKPITSMQLLQMVAGVSITALAYYFESSDTACSRTYADSGFFTFCSVLYGSYLVLFAKLYHDSYIKRSRKQTPAAESRQRSKKD